MSEKKPDEKLVRAINPFGLRMLPELKQRLEEAAQQSGKSLNGEIVDRLAQSFEWARILDGIREAEERLFEQAKVERELRRQIDQLQQHIDLLQSGTPSVDLTSPAVQDAMVQRMQEVLGTVVEDMREEQRITSGMPLLLRWWEDNPAERAAYDHLSEDEQDEYVRETAHQLWIDHLNLTRQSRPAGNRRAAVKTTTKSAPRARKSATKK